MDVEIDAPVVKVDVCAFEDVEPILANPIQGAKVKCTIGGQTSRTKTTGANGCVEPAVRLFR